MEIFIFMYSLFIGVSSRGGGGRLLGWRGQSEERRDNVTGDNVRTTRRVHKGVCRVSTATLTCRYVVSMLDLRLLDRPEMPMRDCSLHVSLRRLKAPPTHSPPPPPNVRHHCVFCAKAWKLGLPFLISLHDDLSIRFFFFFRCYHKFCLIS